MIERLALGDLDDHDRDVLAQFHADPPAVAD
jgi:hypothetical protein